MRGRSPSKPREGARGVAELYSAVVLVAVTLAVSYLVFSQVRFPVTAQPVFVATMTQRFGSPSLLLLSVNSSGPSSIEEFRLDSSSSLSGVLALEDGGYTTTNSLCGAALTTFFSVRTTEGILSVSDSGTTFIDGVQSTSSKVAGGWHELIISGSASCEVTLPGGATLAHPSTLISTVPFVQPSPQSFVFLIPFTASGHTITVSFDGVVETYGF